MKPADLKHLSDENLAKKAKSQTTLVWILGVLSLVLAVFSVLDYLKAEELDFAMLTIAICTIGGFVVVWQELNLVNKEMAEREQVQ